MNPVETLARHVTATRPEDLPPEAVAATRTFLLDTLGVAVAGSGEGHAGRILDTVAGWGAGDEATAWVHGTRLPAGSAALVNAYQIHCLEFDCVHEAAVVHPMAAVTAAALAQAERGGGVDGPALLAALALGVDVAATVGRAARGPMRFFRPATAGAFGATAAAGRLAGLDADGLANALGLVYGQVSGTLQPHVEGSPLLGLQMGFNARAALAAVALTEAGVPGPRDVLTGPYGYLRLFEGDDFSLEPFGALGREWQIAGVSHKPFPSGRLTHGVAQALLELRERHGFGAADVAGVTARVPPLVKRLVGRPDVADPAPGYARLCLPFVAATALVRGAVDVPDFRPGRLAEPAVHEVAARIAVEETAGPDPNALVPQAVSVRLHDGTTHEVRLERVLGHPEAPLSAEQNRAKFRRNWGHGARALPAAAGEALIERVEALGAPQGPADTGELIALLTAR